MKRIALGAGLALLLGLILGGAIHIAAILALPRLATDTPGAQLAPYLSAGRFTALPAVTGDGDAPRFLDPAMRYAVCPFDVGERAGRFLADLDADYWSVSFHSEQGWTFYTINNRATGDEEIEVLLVPEGGVAALQRALPDGGEGRLIVEAPSERGFVMIRALVSGPSFLPLVETGLAAAECGPIS